MPSGTHSETLQVSGTVFTRTKNLTADNASAYGDATSPITLAAGKTVTSWVKTDADTAACDLPSGHGYTDGKFDVYSSAGVLYRYGVDGTIATNALTLDGGTAPAYSSGFPDTATSGVIVCKQQQVNVGIDGDNASLVGFWADAICHVDCQDVSSNSIRAFSMAAEEADCWDSESGIDPDTGEIGVNPYTGNPITKVLISNGTTTAGTFKAVVLQDSTP